MRCETEAIHLAMQAQSLHGARCETPRCGRCSHGVAAWQWLQVGYLRARTLATTQGREVPGLDAALFSHLVQPQFILESVDSHVLGASLGHASWAVLLYPLDVVRVGEWLEGARFPVHASGDVLCPRDGPQTLAGHSIPQ